MMFVFGKTDLPLRVVMTVVAALFVAVRAYCTGYAGFMKQLQPPMESSQHEDPSYQLVVLGASAAVAGLTWLYLMFAPFDRLLPVPQPVRYALVLVALGCVGLLYWVHTVMGKSWNPYVAMLPEQTLVTSGPFAFVRHPMYTAFFTFGVVYGLASRSLLLTSAWVAWCAIITVRIPIEEALLTETFGDAYRTYQADVPAALIPGVW
eukprot:Sspe_Gene.88642::Locus_60599_Transcript_2_2_Confidence_0.667_Length_864::g.88642::m.88642